MNFQQENRGPKSRTWMILKFLMKIPINWHNYFMKKRKEKNMITKTEWY